MDYLTKLTKKRPRNNNGKSSRDLLAETESNRGRIVQSAAVRRLQQKTQVYPLETNASVRSRLTHSLEVQQVGRFLSQEILHKLHTTSGLASFNLKGHETAFINLVEMACLLHDVGNPPFGHFGEAAISQWIQENALDCYQQALGKNPGKSTPLFHATLLPDLQVFEGNAQGLRIIHQLQNLNLTYSQMAALIKYTRPAYIKKPLRHASDHYRKKKPGFYFSEQVLVEELNKQLHIAEGCRFPLTYIMEAADDISYCIADLEDAIDKGILSFQDLRRHLATEWHRLTHSKSTYLPDIIESALQRSGTNEQDFIVKLRTRMIRELVDYAANRYLQQHDAVFNGTLDEPLIEGESDQHYALTTLKNIAIRHVFNRREKETPELRGYSALRGLLNIFQPLLKLSASDFSDILMTDHDDYFIEQRLCHRLPKKYLAAYTKAVKSTKQLSYLPREQLDLEWYYRCRLLIDYVSGMTDHFVVTEYQSLSAI